MKVIDLLNKIANGEELPEKIKYQDNIYYMVGNNDYENFEYEEEPTLMYALGSTHHITDEVEIIEDKQEPKPITKKDLEAIGYAFGEMRKSLQKGWNKSLNNEPFKEDKKIEKIPMVNEFESNIVSHNQTRIKINEIIEKLNKEK